MDNTARQYIISKVSRVIGYISCLSQVTRSDIVTIINMLAKYQIKYLPGHYTTSLHSLQYPKHITLYGHYIIQKISSDIHTFLKSPIEYNTSIASTDTNWGPQYQINLTKFNSDSLPPFKPYYIYGYLIFMYGSV